MNAKDLLMLTVEAADAKKAEEIISLNMSGVSDLTDYFVVCHGNNERQVKRLLVLLKKVLSHTKLK